MRREGWLLCAVLGGWPGGLFAGTATLIQQGRRVYIAEGCIHCHSQYVRPDTIDEERWGAPHPLAGLERERPPLFGNRRQGPDLQNVGSRRPADWLRLQLQAPRTIMAGSRMPSYAHLFRPGHTEGEALIAYLESLREPSP
jgi:cbb3-type cytochrome c oxidase subunit II